MRKTGEVYLKVARLYLDQLVDAENRAEIASKLKEISETKDFSAVSDYIDECVGYDGFCNDVTETIRAIFDKFTSIGDVATRDQYLQHVLFGAERPDGLKLNQIDGSTADLGRLMCDALRGIHNEWATWHVEDFCQKFMEGKQYMFMPFEMIGWKTIRPGYIVLITLLEDLGFGKETSTALNQLVEDPAALEAIVEEAYLRESGTFFREIVFGCYFSTLRDYIRDYIGNGRHSEVPSLIQDKLRDRDSILPDKVEKQLKYAW